MGRMIVFVNPPVSLWERYRRLSGAGSVVPPLGLCYLASVARDRGFGTAIIDAVALGLSKEDAVERILEYEPDFVGVTATTLTIKNAAAIAGALKARDKDIVTIVGGPHITSVPLETMQRYEQFDIGVIGEGELATAGLLEALKEGRDISPVGSLIFRRNSSVQINPRMAYIEDLDTLPYPAWDYLPALDKYYEPPGDNVTRYPNTSIITSRGCPKRCSFCDRSVFGNRYRFHSPEYILSMIRLLYDKYGIRDLAIWDDNFMGNRKVVTEVCEGLRKEGLDLVWSAQGTVDCAEPGLLRLMKEAGCWQIGWGLESGSQGILDFYKKGIGLSQSRKAIRLAKEAGIRNRGYFMAANFTETKTTLKETLDFIKELDLDEFEMSCLIPFPGTELYGIADQYGTFNKEWEGMDPYTPSFIPNGLSAADIERFHKAAFRIVYLRPKTIWHFFKKTINLRQWRLSLKILRSAIALLRFSFSRDYGEAGPDTAKLSLPRRERVTVTSGDDPAESYYDYRLRYLYRKRLDMTRRLLRGRHFNELLEIGYGSGIFLPELAKYTERLYGVDIHGKEKEITIMLKAENVKAGLTCADVASLPFEDQRFDCLVCLSVLEFIDDIRGAVNEMRRVIKKGGYLVCGAPVLNGITDFAYSMVGFRDHKSRHKSSHRDIISAVAGSFKVEETVRLPSFLPIDSSLFFCLRAVK